jgi:hypothetical protein
MVRSCGARTVDMRAFQHVPRTQIERYGVANKRDHLPTSGRSTRRGISDPNGGLKLINKSRDARVTSAIEWMKGSQVLTRLA